MTDVDRLKRLTDFISASQESPCQWGKDDCSMFAGRWVEVERGINLGLPRYSSEDAARKMIAVAGGLDRVWERIANKAGIFETDAPKIGDVGLIATRKFGPVGVIVAFDGACAWRAENGVSFLHPREFIRAWAV